MIGEDLISLCELIKVNVTEFSTLVRAVWEGKECFIMWPTLQNGLDFGS